MNRRKLFPLLLLGILPFFLGCVPLIEKSLIPGSSDDLSACLAVFPTEPWESVHKIEPTIQGMAFSALLGVTKGDPTTGELHNFLLTPEGFILFEAELRHGKNRMLQAVSPFDSPAFAKGLMEDVTLFFLSPQGKPVSWGKREDGSRICNWEGPNGAHIQIKGSIESGWQIIRQDDHGDATREVSLNGPFIHGLASHLELRAFKPASYKLRMTLIRMTP